MNNQALVGNSMGAISIILIIISILLFLLQLAVCFAIISMKNSLSDIADVYCKLNKEKYFSLKEKEIKSEYGHSDI